MVYLPLQEKDGNRMNFQEWNFQMSEIQVFGIFKEVDFSCKK
jgi:hypothetical protein